MTQKITEKLMSQIESGRVTMKPRWHFVLRGALVGLGLFVSVLATVFMFGFLVFAMRVSGILEMPVFGWRGYREFLLAFPWLISLLLLLLMLGVELYARKFSFAYRLPVLGSIVIVILLVSTAGIALGYYLENNCPARGTMVGAALGRMRASAVVQPGLIHVGEVSQVGPEGYVLSDSDGDIAVIIDSDTRLMFDEIVEIGDEIIVFGEQIGEDLKAFGIRPAPRNGHRPFPGRGGCLGAGDNHGPEFRRPLPGVMMENR